jgi:hypothetical protein
MINDKHYVINKYNEMLKYNIINHSLFTALYTLKVLYCPHITLQKFNKSQQLS